MLYNLAPKSLGDPEGLAVVGVPEATLNKQIAKWFQNNDHYDRKMCGSSVQYRKPRAAITLGEEDSDEDSDVDHHVRELTKEMGKKYWDNDKIVRLLSLSYRSRTRSMASEKVCHLRITGTTSKFPCFKQPLYIAQEFFHKQGMMFESTGDVLDKLRLLQLKWKSSFVPAMLEFITNLKHKEPLDDINICGEDIDEEERLHWKCLLALLMQLKPKNCKAAVRDRLSYIVHADKSLNDCTSRNKWKDPYIVFTGSPGKIQDCAVICNGKISVCGKSGYALFNMLLLFIAFHHVYNLEYNADIREAMEFIQEKLTGIVEGNKRSTAFVNLFRTITCLEEQFALSQSQEDDECSVDSDETRCDELETLYSCPC